MDGDRGVHLAGKRGIQSVEVGWTLIEVLERAARALPLKQLAEEAGMPSSRAHLYMVSFQRLGLVRQSGRNGRYCLGPAALRLGAAAISQFDVVDAAMPVLERLSQEHAQAFTLSIWGNRGPTIIYKLDGRDRSPFAIKVGSVLPLLTTATGRTFLAHLPRSEWAEIAAYEEKLSPGSLHEAEARAEAIRSTGIAMTEGRLQAGFYGICAPIFAVDGRIQATLTAVGSVALGEPSLNRTLQKALRAAALDIGHQAGSSVSD
ncbi:IclR family transcriptional regulator [Roseivivax marinus]|uniref:IclR family transcriptional regulator n=1 Tax=Roseivivax marinus TaxID=1379903 RepID=UPI001F047696|nr:IclR family transcriptional regulator [Roseivivax marinus]UMA64408.1 IclR family transcriptional regulator [Roseivivax marinus]